MRTLSNTLRLFSRWKNWKTKPIRERRNRASSASLRPASAVPPTVTVPDVGRSSPATRLRSVDLPPPDGPMMAVNSPSSTWRLRSSITGRLAGPPYDLVTALNSTLAWMIAYCRRVGRAKSMVRRDVGILLWALLVRPVLRTEWHGGQRPPSAAKMRYRTWLCGGVRSTNRRTQADQRL